MSQYSTIVQIELCAQDESKLTFTTRLLSVLRTNTRMEAMSNDANLNIMEIFPANCVSVVLKLVGRIFQISYLTVL